MNKSDLKKHPFTITLCALYLFLLVFLSVFGVVVKFGGYTPAEDFNIKMFEVLFGCSYKGNAFCGFSFQVFFAYLLVTFALIGFILNKIYLKENVYIKTVIACLFFICGALFILTPTFINATSYAKLVIDGASVKAGIGAVLSGALSLISGILVIIDTAVFKKMN